jgi:hypothetical protein
MPPDAVVLVAAVCASLETLDYLLQCPPRKIAARRFDDTGCITMVSTYRRNITNVATGRAICSSGRKRRAILREACATRVEAACGEMLR